MLKKQGYPEPGLIKSKFPDEDLLVKAKAIIECYEEIPCNPCSTVCPAEAIFIGKDINSIPRLDFEKCTGCGLCITACPGLAIMTARVEGDKVRFRIPYEMLPVPVPGAIWHAVNRAGAVIGAAYIDKVFAGKKQDKTLALEVIVPYSLLYEFITVRSPDE